MSPLQPEKLADRPEWLNPSLRLVLCAVIGLAVVLRFVRLDLMEFKGDEFLALTLASHYLEEGSWPLVSLRSSQGLFYPPLFLWLLMPAVWLTQDPVRVTACIALVNSCGLWFLYRLLRQAYPASTALAGTALFAAAPWSFIHARKIWSPDILPPFAIASLFMAYRYAQRPTVSAAVLLGLCLALSTQLHLSAWWLLPGIGAFFYCRRVHPRPRQVIGAGLALLLPYLPYAYYQFHTNFSNLGEITFHAPAIPVQHLFWGLSSSSGLGFEFLLGASGVRQFLAQPGMALVACLSATLLPLAAAEMLISARTLVRHSGPEQALSLLLMLTFVGVQLGFGITCLPALPHYYVATSPIPAVWAALALARLARAAQPLAAALLVSLLLAQLAYTAGLLQLLDRSPRSLSGQYGMPYGHVRGTWNERFESWRAGDLRLSPRQLPQRLDP